MSTSDTRRESAGRCQMPSAENANARSGKSLAAPAAIGLGVAALRRRIARVELGLHEAKDRRRQAGLKRTARAIDQEDVVAFVDTRRQHGRPGEQAAAGGQYGREPPQTAVRDRPVTISTAADHQQPRSGADR